MIVHVLCCGHVLSSCETSSLASSVVRTFGLCSDIYCTREEGESFGILKMVVEKTCACTLQ